MGILSKKEHFLFILFLCKNYDANGNAFNNSLLIVLQCSFASLQIVLSAMFVMLVSVKEGNSNDELLSRFRHIKSIFCKTKQNNTKTEFVTFRNLLR